MDDSGVSWRGASRGAGHKPLSQAKVKERAEKIGQKTIAVMTKESNTEQKKKRNTKGKKKTKGDGKAKAKEPTALEIYREQLRKLRLHPEPNNPYVLVAGHCLQYSVVSVKFENCWMLNGIRHGANKQNIVTVLFF